MDNEKRGRTRPLFYVARYIDTFGESFYKQCSYPCAPIAQLDRAFDYESKGRKFESCWAHFFEESFLLKSFVK